MEENTTMTDTEDTSPTAAVADAILQLTYGELMDIGAMLRDIHTDRSNDLTDHAVWAEMLHDWASQEA